MLYRSAMNMDLRCEVKGLGHRYDSKFLFRDLAFVFETGKIQFIRGLNGAGKSTLLKIISLGMEPVEGSVQYFQSQNLQVPEVVMPLVAFVAPYLGLPEELTLRELINFQVKIAPQCGTFESYLKRVEQFEMEAHLDRILQQYSTGMMQKAKLILALCSFRDIWILDEPGSNLDPRTFAVFWELVKENKKNKLIIVASNDNLELPFADSILEL